MSDNPHILVVDDEPDIRKVIKIHLNSNGYRVLEAANGKQAIEILNAYHDIDLIIMDIMMPAMSGIEASREIRRFSTAPILFLTALTQQNKMAEAYKSGGDDFLEKPFSQSELLLKAESLIRRYRVYKGKKASENTAFKLDIVRNGFSIHGNFISLTDTEFGIIKYLLENRGKVVSIEELYEGVWKEKYFPSDANTVMVHILKLRKKTEVYSDTPIIKTIWGKGYCID